MVFFFYGFGVFMLFDGFWWFLSLVGALKLSKDLCQLGGFVSFPKGAVAVFFFF